MFVNNINPTLITLGQFQIRYYGLIYAFGFLLAILFLRYFARKGYVKLKDDEIYDLVFWLIIGIVVGARIFEVFIWNPGYYFANPGQMLAIWRGGLSFHGAFAGAIAAMYFFCKKHNLSFMRMADLIVIPAALAVALGRIGNFLNSELYGYPTDVSWCVVFKRVDDICRHPYQLYSAIKRTLIFGILFYLNTKKHKDGFIFWMFIFLMGIGRFFLDYLRVDDLYFSLSTGQWLSLIMAVIGGYVLIKDHLRKK